MSIGASGSVKDSEKDTKFEGTKSGTQTSQLVLDQAAVTKMIEDVLGSESGLSDIFSKDSASGLYGSTAATQASGDLVANLVGELAKLTGKTTQTTEEKAKSKTNEDNFESSATLSGLMEFG